jgi:hypothetical protein
MACLDVLFLFNHVFLFFAFFSACSQIQFESYTVVAYCEVYLACAVVAASSVEVGIGVLWVDLDNLGEISDGLFVPAEPFV